MRAVVLGADSRWTVREVAAPEPEPDEVLLRVRAAGLNHADLLARDGRYRAGGDGWRVDPDRVGFEAAGEVVGLGAAVTGVRVGDRAAAQVGGACADLVTVDAAQLLPVPERWSWIEAAATPSAALTAYDALTGPADLREGEHVLVTGASSGVGLVAVQLAGALGAGRVTGTTRRNSRVPAVRKAGAHAVIVDDGRAWADDRPYDVVLDLVGGSLLERLLPRVGHRGQVAQVGRLGGDDVRLDLDLLARQRITLTGTTFRGRDRAELRDLVGRLARSGVLGRLSPRIASSHDLADAERAAQALRGGSGIGKVVLEL